MRDPGDAPGMKWRNVGGTPPPFGTELKNSQLSQLLAVQLAKSRPNDVLKLEKVDHRDECNLRAVRPNDFIKVGSSYFQPATDDRCWFCKKKPEVLNEESIPVSLDPMLMRRPASGLTWREVTNESACGLLRRFGEELTEQQELADSLARKHQIDPHKQLFTPAEWDAFGITGLRTDHFIKSGTLYFQPAERGLSAADLHARMAWEDLKKWKGLSVLEEALVSRVSCIVSVVQLPGSWVDNKQYSQLGYRGSVINFVNDLSTVAAQLPRAPKDTGIMVYKSEGVTKHGKAYSELLRVRRDAVKEYLEFFAEHHELYREGIVDPNNPAVQLVPKFTKADIDKAVLDSLPKDGVPDDIREHILEAHEDCGADEHAVADREEEKESDLDPDAEGDETLESASKRAAVPLQERELHRRPISEGLLGRWIQSGQDPLAQDLRVKLLKEGGIDPSSAGGLEDALCAIHGVQRYESRWTNELTVERLARRLCEAGLVGDGGAELPSLASNMLAEGLVAVARTINSEFEESGVAHGAAPKENLDPEQSLHQDLRAVLNGQEGTDEAPNKLPARGTVPISEFRAKGYMALAFPTLFPFGRGDFGRIVVAGNQHDLTFAQWSQHLQKYSDQRFATHRSFPYFMLNTHEREVASRQSGLFVKEFDRRHWTIGDLRKLSKDGKQEVMRNLSKFSATLRNTPAFFNERRKELAAMCEQLGDPHVFATTSHADTYCPYLHAFIKTWAQIEDDSPDNPDVDCTLEISSDERYTRRAKNLARYPHIVATFFHLKMKLYIEHVCKGILGANAWWMRYECARARSLDTALARYGSPSH